MSFIKAKNLKHRFARRDEKGEVIGEVPALDGIDIDVEPGQFIAVVGRNGSGKSTFAKHLNALLFPTEGTLFVDGRDVEDKNETWNIRQSAGMVFQNPDNQIVAGVVEEDVAFGPENLGIPPDEIRARVAHSLEMVDMADYGRHSPDRLSGGQKQRVAVAGVLAMRPKCVIMDEATAMLDPSGRREVLRTAHMLNRGEGVTVIFITHFMEEAAEADYVFVLDRGRVAMRGTPREVFPRGDELRKYGLDVPQMARLSLELKREGFPIPDDILNRGELVDVLCREILKPPCADHSLPPARSGQEGGCGRPSSDLRPGATGIGRKKHNHPDPSAWNKEGVGNFSKTPGGKECGEKLRMEGVSYSYGAGTAWEKHALKGIDLTVRGGEFIGLIGHTGSGKSTLVQLLSGLLTADEGRIFYGGRDICEPGFSMRSLRGKVGLVFQHAEHQLFEATVLRDVAFGPKNQGMGENEAFEKAEAALRRMRIDESCWGMSPFELSGGQKKRAAIAGVLAMEPDVLILDEPTTGLDPGGRDELFSLIRALRAQLHVTVLLVSHSMEDVADHVGRVIVLDRGKIMLDGSPAEVFTHIGELEGAGLSVPQATCLMADLKARGYPADISATTLEEAKREIERLC